MSMVLSFFHKIPFDRNAKAAKRGENMRIGEPCDGENT